MADIIYTTKKYRILQKTGENTANLMHPETEAVITLIKPFEDIIGPDTQKALEQLNAKINIAQNSILFNTKAEWDAQPTLRTQANIIYVYTDAFELESGEKIAGIKIGDGNAYLIDKAFISDYLANQIAELITQFQAHLADNVRHITGEERTKWNNKLNYELSEEEPETLIFNRN